MDLIIWPVVAVAILDPFKITANHAARVCQHVWNNSDLFLTQNFVCLRSGWPVSKFDNYFGFNLVSVFSSNLVFKGSRHEDAHIKLKKLLVGDDLCLGIINNRALVVAFCNQAFLELAGHDRSWLKPGRVVNSAM